MLMRCGGVLEGGNRRSAAGMVVGNAVMVKSGIGFAKRGTSGAAARSVWWDRKRRAAVLAVVGCCNSVDTAGWARAWALVLKVVGGLGRCGSTVGAVASC